jgi:hypothetical protein
MKMLSFALAAASIVSTPASVGVDSAAADYLRPVLNSVGGAARIDYAGTCTGRKKLVLPTVDVQPTSQGITGVTAVREIFRNDPQVTVTRGHSGMLRVTIGNVSTSALQTKIPALTLDSYSQYSPLSAVAAIAFWLNTYAAEHSMHLGMAAIVIDIIVSGPIPGAPHLPPRMQNVTVDDALDSVARSFKGIVLYGTCTQPDGEELFDIKYIDGS